jgi:hypothetical protein
VFLRKCPAGVGFEIFLKFQRFVFIGEGAVPRQLPRLEFSGVARLAGIVLGSRRFKSALAPMYSCSGKLMLRMM